MDKSYKKNNINKWKKNYYKYKRYNSKAVKRKASNLYGKLLAQILVSIIIVLLIILLKSINTTITEETSSFIKNAVYAEFDYRESINKVREYTLRLRDYAVKDIPAFNRFQKELNLSRPIEGVIISSYGENYDPITEKNTFQRGIDIKGVNFNIVKSVRDGVIEKIGESDDLGKFVKIDHGENTFSLYSNLEKVYVKENDRIIRGERIGEIGDLDSSYLHFELWIDNDIVNPELYIDYDASSI